MTRSRDLAGAMTAIAAAMPLPALAQHLGGGTDPEISLVRIIVALVICIAAAAALALVIAKRGLLAKGGPAKRWSREGLRAKLRSRHRITIVEARRISPHADICLARCDGREYLIVCGPGDIRVLAEGAAMPDDGAAPRQDC